VRKEEWEWKDATPADDREHCDTSIDDTTFRRASPTTNPTRARLAIAQTHIVTADTNGGVTDAMSPETTTTVIINIVDTTGTVSISGTSSQYTCTNNA